MWFTVRLTEDGKSRHSRAALQVSDSLPSGSFRLCVRVSEWAERERSHFLERYVPLSLALPPSSLLPTSSPFAISRRVDLFRPLFPLFSHLLCDFLAGLGANRRLPLSLVSSRPRLDFRVYRTLNCCTERTFLQPLYVSRQVVYISRWTISTLLLLSFSFSSHAQRLIPYSSHSSLSCQLSHDLVTTLVNLIYPRIFRIYYAYLRNGRYVLRSLLAASATDWWCFREWLPYAAAA